MDAVKGRADALYVCQDLLTRGSRLRINTLALAARLPVMHGSREFIEAAGLMSTFLYAFDLIELNGDDLRRDPLEGPKVTLASIVAKAGPA